VFLPVMGGLVALAWLTLWAWSRSPYGRYLEHGDWLGGSPFADICRALPAGTVLVPAFAHAAGWVLMIAAMMLPTILPLLEQFRRLIASRHDRGPLLLLLVGGYLAVWALFGLVAHALDRAVLAVFAQVPWLTFNGWIVGAGVIAGAGAYQFSALKYRCLEKCRTPFSFVSQHWRGRTPRCDAFMLGAHHGAFCVGCCWALMLLMFVVGTGSIGWMLALGAVMAVEKNMSWGKQLSTPLGALLLVWAGTTVVLHTGVPGG
jgi:predicted metal-binding membrane protein